MSSTRFFLFFFILLPLCVYSQNMVRISDPLLEQYNLGVPLYFMEDTSGKLTYDLVSISPFHHFKANPSSGISISDGKPHTYWGVVTVVNARKGLVKYNFKCGSNDFDTVAIYFTDHQKFVVRNLFYTGNLNDLVSDFFLGEDYPETLWIKYVTKPNLTHCTLSLSLQSEYIKANRLENQHLIIGLLVGVLCLAFIYTFFLFFSFRETTYLWFALLQLGLICFFSDFVGISGTLLERNDVQIFLSDISGTFILIGVTCFCTSFIRLKVFNPMLHRGVVCFGILVGISWYFADVKWFHFSDFITPLSITTLILFGCLIALSIYGALKKLPFAWLLLISLLLLLAPFIYALVTLITGSELPGDNAILLCSDIQVIVWLGMVSYKIRYLRLSEKRQQSLLIESLEENEHLIADQNRLLEIKVRERTQQLASEKKKSDDLLLNILPAEVAEELKARGSSEAKLYNPVTVLFTDFVNFSGISEHMNPTELVAEIHRHFTAFDSIMEHHGLEKIKTIGDAYLAVCGLPNEMPDHAQRVVKAALDIQSYIHGGSSKFRIRIGIHSGPVVAGIVGVKKYAYDIWGDTVNTAARMEQHSEPGKINISGATYDLVKNDFACEYRGKVQAKNKGEIDMYFVNGII